MPVVHFLNVKDGDCSLIQHGSGHVSVIDVCNARKEDEVQKILEALNRAATRAAGGNFQQKKSPVNPIAYMKDLGLDKNRVFRFILTHPDMDHMDGIVDFFDVHKPINFWDTDNQEEKEFGEGALYREEDWDFYTKLRDGKPESDPKRLTLHAGATGQYWNVGQDGTGGGDGLQILAPTKALVDDACECGDYNDCSYVLLYRAGGNRVLFAGDSHDKTWEHILDNYKDDVTDIDVLIAPHHGRKSGRSYDFLDVLNPTVTLFGNAPSEDLAYGAWNNRDLLFITNNQAGCVIIDASESPAKLYVTNEEYARKCNPDTEYSATFRAWFLMETKRDET